MHDTCSTPETGYGDRASSRCDRPSPVVRVVVTGGAGFIGANLCHMLDQEDFVDHVVALDDLSTGSRHNLAASPSVEFREGSILDPDELDRVMADTQAVVHLAARPSVPRSLADPMATHQVNATGTMMVLEAARRHGLPQVIVASSSSVYGANPALPKREDLVAMPVSPYAASKLATEAYTLSYGRSFGLPVLAFRFFNVFGPLQSAGHAYAAVVPAFVSSALAGEPLPVQGDGTQTRDFTFVGTVTSVLADAVRRRVIDPEPVNLAYGSRVSLLDLIAVLEGIMGRELPRNHLEPRAGDVRDSQADHTRLRMLFPEIRPTTLEEGLRATVAWFRETH
jgi:UDP-glucose 4-epimerase